MKTRSLAALALVATACVAACSTEEPTALEAREPAAAGSPDGDEHGDEAEGGDFGTPVDDPAIGGDLGLGGGAPPPAPAAPPAAPSARVPSPVPGKSVTYAFGVKNTRYAAGYHTGEDYATPTGSNAVAVRSGTIRYSNDAGGAYGKWIGLDADNGRTYVYCHLSTRLVAAGTKVSAGQVIAKTGATGNVTGPHLHFEDHPRGPFVYAQVRKPAW